MACDSCPTELKPGNFLLGYDIPGHFAKFQCGYPKLYLGWRVFWAVYHTAWIIVTGLMAHQWAPDTSQHVKWFIYLTDWSYFMLTLSDVISAAAVVHVFKRRKDLLKCDEDEMPWYLKSVWVLFNVANSASLATSILYWALLYGPQITMTAVDAETHGVNSIYVLVNICLTGSPIRIYHFFHPLIYGVVYWLFSVFYFLAGGTNVDGMPYVYTVLDWREPGTAAMYIGLTAFVLLPVCHVVMYFLTVARLAVYRTCCLKRTTINATGSNTKNDIV
ncbi:hypothetical protein ScPMuIL_017236 [Solemya velum]